MLGIFVQGHMPIIQNVFIAVFLVELLITVSSHLHFLLQLYMTFLKHLAISNVTFNSKMLEKKINTA